MHPYNGYSIHNKGKNMPEELEMNWDDDVRVNRYKVVLIPEDTSQEVVLEDDIHGGDAADARADYWESQYPCGVVFLRVYSVTHTFISPLDEEGIYL